MNTELLKKLTQCDSASGNEDNIAALITEAVSGYADEIYRDAIGNLIVHKKGSGKKLVFAAHMDEIGVVVTFVDEKGFLRFSNVGGLYNKELLGRKVRFADGTIGVIGTEKENSKLQIRNMYLDIGAKNREEAEKVAGVGATGCFVGDFFQNGEVMISKAMDNRAGCYVLIEALKQAKTENDLYFIFTAQEEVGLRGAKTAAFDLDADLAIAVDVTDTGDTPNGETMAVELGKGAAIKVMDRSIICDSTVRSTLIALAKKYKIPYQLEVMTDGGTDAGALHLTRSGIRTGGISIPTRYIHSPSEMVHTKDLEAAIALTVAFADVQEL